MLAEALSKELATDPRIAYALLFGSTARGTAHAGSDVDVAVGLSAGTSLNAHDVGDLVSRLESATGRNIDLVLLDEAGPALAYRVFRDGITVLLRDRRAWVERRSRAILDYLDFRPVEERCTRGVLAAAARGR